MTGRNIYDFVQCKPWRRDGESRVLGSLVAPVMYEITGSDASRDKPFIAEVTGVGPGIVDQAGNREKMCVGVGDVFVCTLHNISYKLTEGGVKTYVVRNGVVYAKIDQETFAMKPVQDIILVRTGESLSVKATPLNKLTVEKRALLHMRGEGQVWLPTEAMSTDDVKSSAILAEYGEVVAVGPGRYRDGRWSEPPCRVGDLILYDASYSTLPVRIRGESFTLVPAPQLVKVADEA
jgi:co-chaperonin GroES (HSP10)